MRHYVTWLVVTTRVHTQSGEPGVSTFAKCRSRDRTRKQRGCATPTRRKKPHARGHALGDRDRSNSTQKPGERSHPSLQDRAKQNPRRRHPRLASARSIPPLGGHLRIYARTHRTLGEGSRSVKLNCPLEEQRKLARCSRCYLIRRERFACGHASTRIWRGKIDLSRGPPARERNGKTGWRRGWDSNPRLSFPNTRFPSVLLKPLGHLSPAYIRWLSELGQSRSATHHLVRWLILRRGAANPKSGPTGRAYQPPQLRCCKPRVLIVRNFHCGSDNADP